MREIKSMIAVAKAAFHMKWTLYHQQTVRERKERTSKVLQLEQALYGTETWTLRKVDQKYLESFEMWCWRRMEKFS
jgi:hypothetical protein